MVPVIRATRSLPAGGAGSPGFAVFESTMPEATAHAVADRARVIQLATLMNDVNLQRQRERMGETPLQASAAVEALAVLGGVDTLPVQPQVVLETGTLKEPLQPGLVRAIEGEPLALNRREQSMRTGAIGTRGAYRRVACRAFRR